MFNEKMIFTIFNKIKLAGWSAGFRLLKLHHQFYIQLTGGEVVGNGILHA